MKIKNLKLISYMYLIIPIIIFFIGWLKVWISIPLSLLLVIGIIKKFKKEEKEEEVFISKSSLLIIFEIVLIISITAGQGNIFYQNEDWHWRNAIFRDLIKFDWPVYYENINASLTYYIGFWMVPAVFGKIFFGIFQENVAWQLANLIQLVWCTIGVTLAILWIIKALKVNRTRKILIVLLLFFGFSGLDIIGVLVTKEYWMIELLQHTERWPRVYQYSSNIVQLFWVFNQCVYAWLITMMFIDEKKVNNFFLLILVALPYSPLPFIGLMPLFFVRGLKYLIIAIKEKKIKEFFKDVFSFQNIISLISILPIFFFYYYGNMATTSSDGGLRLSNIKDMGILIWFYILEFGGYSLLLWKENRKDELFYTAIISLFIIPLFEIGSSCDFCMRVSIPALMLITYYLIKYLINAKLKSIRTILIIIVFAIGFVTPFFEYKRAFFYIEARRKKLDLLVADNIYSLSDHPAEENENFLTTNPKENSIFFKYIAK